MLKSTHLWLLFLSLSLLAGACKKETTDPPVDPQTELLAKTWKPDTLILDGVDRTILLQNARVRFTTNGRYYINDALLGNDSGSWVFANDKTEIVFDQGFNPERWQIIALNGNLLKVSSDHEGESMEASWSPAN